MKTFGRAWLYAYVVLAIVGALFARGDGEATVKALVLAVLEAVVVAAIFVVVILPRRK